MKPEDSAYQNIVLIDAEVGADVEVHPVVNSESLFFLAGQFEILNDTGVHPVGPGIVAYFEPGEAHGLRCTDGPGQYLVIFAPTHSHP